MYLLYLYMHDLKKIFLYPILLYQDELSYGRGSSVLYLRLDLFPEEINQSPAFVLCSWRISMHGCRCVTLLSPTILASSTALRCIKNARKFSAVYKHCALLALLDSEASRLRNAAGDLPNRRRFWRRFGSEQRKAKSDSCNSNNTNSDDDDKNIT